VTSRARLYSLYARREAAAVAGLGRAVADAASEHAKAEARSAKLRQLAQEMHLLSGPSLAANLRANGMLTTGLVEEAERQSRMAENVSVEIARLRQTLGLHDRRRHFGETAATAARAAEQEEAEARAEAARPPHRRPR
jgi:hypothetical protein